MEHKKKPGGLHESFEREDEVKGSSNRGFGLTVGGILLLIAAYRSYSADELDYISIALFALGGPLVLLGLVLPNSLAALNRAWTRFGLILFKVVNPLVMGLIFFVTVTPIGLAMRLTGGDPLRLKMAPGEKSYWIQRSPPGPAPETMKNQF